MCVAHCPRHMHPYHTRCNGQTLSQKTCDEPQVYVLGYTCGWSRCDCNGDLLLDERSGTCITSDVCMDIPERLQARMDRMKERKRGRRLRMSKKIKITEDELTHLI
ncbi:unnamed protein product [Colias eurytheme]|nr:unnamed protein product [Colias eurytheme]